MKIIYFLLLSMFWGGSFLAISVSLRGFSPFLAAMLRVAIATVMIFVYILWKKEKFPSKNIIIQAILNGVIGIGIPWALLFWGEQFVPPSLCSIVNATSPIFTAIFAAIVVHSAQDKMTWNKSIGTVLGFLGIAVIFGPFVSSQSLQSFWGLSALVGMALCYGFSIAWLKKLAEHATVGMLMFLECSGALIILMPIAVVYGITNYSLTGSELLKPIIAILYLGVFSTFIAFIFFYKLLKLSGSIEAAAVTYMIPIVSIFLDWFILDKWIGSHALFGALIVFAALRLINRPVKVIVD